MLRRGCLSSCTSCLLPIVIVLAVVGFLYHQVTTAPAAYPAVVPSPAAALEAAVRGAAGTAARRGESVATISLGNGEVTRLLRLSDGTATPLGDLTAHVEPGLVVVTASLAPLGQRIAVVARYRVQPGGGAAIDLHPIGVGVGQFGLPGAIDPLVAAGLPGQLDLGRAGGPRALTVLCLAADPGRLEVAFRLPGSGQVGGVALCAGPGT